MAEIYIPDYLLRLIGESFLGKVAIDTAGRLCVKIDVAGVATPVTVSSGAVTVSSGGGFPVEQRWEIIQRANIEYNECQRSKFTFV